MRKSFKWIEVNDGSYVRTKHIAIVGPVDKLTNKYRATGEGFYVDLDATETSRPNFLRMIGVPKKCIVPDPEEK